MSDYESSGQEGTDDAPTKTERRAEWEGFEFRVPVPGVVRVENVSYGDESDDHVYVVSVEGGIPFDCTCPAWEYRNPNDGCKHMVAVENQPAVTRAASSATEATTETTDHTTPDAAKQAVATDGGREVGDTDDADESQNGTDCPECRANDAVAHEPQPGSDTIPTYVCENCGYSTFTPAPEATSNQ